MKHLDLGFSNRVTRDFLVTDIVNRHLLSSLESRHRRQRIAVIVVIVVIFVIVLLMDVTSVKTMPRGSGVNSCFYTPEPQGQSRSLAWQLGL